MNLAAKRKVHWASGSNAGSSLIRRAKSESKKRLPLPGLIALPLEWRTPQPYQIGNISGSGFYLLTDERPYPGTLILMTLQRTGTDGEKVGNSLAVYSKVIRWGQDGVGFSFVTMESQHAKNNGREPQNFANQESLNEFLKKALDRR